MFANLIQDEIQRKETENEKEDEGIGETELCVKRWQNKLKGRSNVKVRDTETERETDRQTERNKESRKQQSKQVRKKKERKKERKKGQ